MKKKSKKNKIDKRVKNRIKIAISRGNIGRQWIRIRRNRGV